jgi:hypothetical protein
MAVKAKDQVTIVDMTDVKAVTIYYLLQLSTLTAPDKPTVLSPSNWSTTEPAFDNTSTNTLYTCVRTLFGDNSFSWGDVNISSSYEAAKAAWNKANQAQTTADGKNTVFYSTAPPTAKKVNDIWFDTDDGNRIYYWNGTAWSASQFGTNAIANASITNALIADATIQNAKIANIDAGKITTGYISADRIQAGTLAIGKLDSSTQSTISTASSTASTALTNAAQAQTAADTANTKLTSWSATDTTCIDGGKIYTDSITSNQIAASAITTSELAAGAVNADKITSNAITTAHIQTGAINADKIASNAITTDKINASAVTADKIVSNAITTDKLAAQAVTANNMAANSITAANAALADASVTNAKIVDATITNAKIANLDAAKITTGTLNADRIGAGAITTAKLASGAVTAEKITADTLSAISANLGTVTAGTLNSVTLNSATINSGTLNIKNNAGAVNFINSDNAQFGQLLATSERSVAVSGGGTYDADNVNLYINSKLLANFQYMKINNTAGSPTYYALKLSNQLSDVEIDTDVLFKAGHTAMFSGEISGGISSVSPTYYNSFSDPIGSSKITLNRFGRFVTIDCYAYRESGTSGSIACMGIPVGYRPTSLKKMMTMNAAAPTSGAEVQIWTDGQIVLWGAWSGPVYAYVHIVYYI